ncbi:MAG: iron-containing alcohol dehydrogenase [Firmicutes bacterium]|nr:iron-containing alcohol dehydrogenase [Bacillota bacterium]
MNNFTYDITTIIHFGIDQLKNLADMKASGSKVLLVYGGGSIKRNGLYDDVMQILSENGLQVTELPGVEPNPRIESVRKGVELCRENELDMVLAVGGGSCIDCAKVIAAGACYDGDAWDLVLDGGKIEKALPVYTVLTLAATGSEMDRFAVISDLEKNEKWGTAADAILPVMSVLNPEYTYSVSPKQTSAGTADIMSHTLENYFNNVKGAYLQSRMCEAILKTLVHYGPIALHQPDNYEARANLMWASSLAINGMVSYGAGVGWCVHPMEHELSAFYDITHGDGLAILTPFWMDHALNAETAWKFGEYGRNVFGITGDDDMEVGRQAIECTREYFKLLNLPATLSDVGIDSTHFDIMAEKAAAGCEGSFVPLSKEDIKSIFMAAL